MATWKWRKQHTVLNCLECKFWILLKGLECLEILLEQNTSLREKEWKLELQCEYHGYICTHKQAFDLILISGKTDDIFNSFLWCSSITWIPASNISKFWSPLFNIHINIHIFSGHRASTTTTPFSYLCCTPSSCLSMHCKCNTNHLCLLKLYHYDREIWLLGLCLKMPAWSRMQSNKTAATCWRDLGEQILPCAPLDKLEETQSIRDTGQRKAVILRACSAFHGNIVPLSVRPCSNSSARSGGHNTLEQRLKQCPRNGPDGYSAISPCGKLTFLFNVWRPFENLQWASVKVLLEESDSSWIAERLSFIGCSQRTQVL